jgi:hypothetical protein
MQKVSITQRWISNSSQTPHNMPILDALPVPTSAQELPIADDAVCKLFLCFISSTDPSTKQPWCPDVRAALPRLEKAFSSQDAPELVYVHVGQKPECVPFPFVAHLACVLAPYLLAADGKNQTMCTGTVGRSMLFRLWYATSVSTI